MSTAPAPDAILARTAELPALARELGAEPRIALDVESNGLFKYRASLCTIQLAGAGKIVVVDTLVTPLDALAGLLSVSGPRKIVHDLAFDARILAESGIELGNVLDTSIAARMLGRTATGLASLLDAELGIRLDKKLQHHDWTERPLLPDQIRYLALDVLHLEALAAKLWAEVEQAEIADEIEEETRYRLAQAIAAAKTVDPRPAWLRLKGIDRVPAGDLPILKRLADLREAKAKDLDVPPYKVIGPDVLFAIARARPKTFDDLASVKGATGGGRARSLASAMLAAVDAGTNEGALSEAEQALVTRPRIAPELAKARRARESRLTSWRKAEAKKRGVDDQVVLPGHCLQDLADVDPPTLEAIARVPGIGAFRVARDGEALVATLTAPEPRPVDEPTP